MCLVDTCEVDEKNNRVFLRCMAHQICAKIEIVVFILVSIEY